MNLFWGLAHLVFRIARRCRDHVAGQVDELVRADGWVQMLKPAFILVLETGVVLVFIDVFIHI